MADPVPTSITQTLPNPYLQGAYTALGERLLPLLATSAGINYSTFMGDKFVAGQNQLQQQAAGLAGGLGSYQPYLQQAGALGEQATQTLAGAQQYSGPQAYQQFMSPYQQDVINTTLGQYDIQAQKGLQPLAAQAIQYGAFGGGREGIQRAEYQNQSDLNRAMLQAQLLNQGFGQAQQAAGQAFTQQQGLASLQPSLAQSSIQQLGGIGTTNLAYQQAILDAQRQAAQTSAYEPYQRAQYLQGAISGLMSGYPQTQVTTAPQPQTTSPLSTALSGAATIYGLGSLFNK